MQNIVNELTEKRNLTILECEDLDRQLWNNRISFIQTQKTFEELIMAKKKSTRELDAEIERLKRQVEIQELKKKLQKGSKK